MLEELRLSPRSPGARSWGRSPGGSAAADRENVKRRLSTGFAEGCATAFHSPWSGLGEAREVTV
jgi:hypothetical protein